MKIIEQMPQEFAMIEFNVNDIVRSGLVREYLVPAVEDGNDITARAHLQVASMMGATAFQKGLGAMHSLAHPCGAVLVVEMRARVRRRRATVRSR